MGFAPRGPLDAKLLVVGNRPDWKSVSKGMMFSTASAEGALLDKALNKTGFSRSDIRLMYLDGEPLKLDKEVRRATKAGCELIMPLGEEPLLALLPDLPHAPVWGDEEKEKVEKKLRIMQWRGSLLPLKGFDKSLEGYSGLLKPQKGPYVLPSYDLAQVAKQIAWFTTMAQDFEKAQTYLKGRWEWPTERKWLVNDYSKLEWMVDECLREGTVGIDTESSPYYIVALVTKKCVFTFAYTAACKEQLERLMGSDCLKIAHNVGHDWTFFQAILSIEVKLPHCDTGGHAHILNSSLRRSLSPAISTRYTQYPYHKWLVDCDPKIYCGYDTVVCYDAYLETSKQIASRGLQEVSDHDHQTLWNFLQMQWKGFKVDERVRQERLEDYKKSQKEASEGYERAVRKLLNDSERDGAKRLKKPHLFFKSKRCPCCGGGKVSRGECWRCDEYDKKPSKSRVASDGKTLGVCVPCGGRGSTVVELPINPSSAAQKADILYSLIGHAPRRFKGSITTRADQISVLAGNELDIASGGIIGQLLQLSKLEADIETLERLSPDYDGRIHSVFDPWGTVSGRAASSEGLLQKGTNVQNLPKRARDVVVADEGKLIIAPDMAQIEGRCVAVVSQDSHLQRAYQEPLDWVGHTRHGTIDSHSYVQQLAHRLGILISRDQAKRCAFGLFYGGAAAQMGTELSAEYIRKEEGCLVSTAEMQLILDEFFRVFNGLPRWRARTFRELASKRWLRSPTGRVRYWSGYIIDRRTKELASKPSKEALSFYPQDMGAWVVAQGLEEMRSRGAGLLEPLIQVHDELVTQIPDSPGRLVDEAVELAVSCMTQNMWGMDFPADTPTPCKNWQGAK